jgi:hypothetical protein
MWACAHLMDVPDQVAMKDLKGYVYNMAKPRALWQRGTLLMKP